MRVWLLHRLDQRLKLRHPVRHQMNVLHQQPVTHLRALRDLLLHFLLNPFRDRKVVQFHWICRPHTLLKSLQLLMDIHRVSHQEQDWRVLSRLFVRFFDQQLVIAVSVLFLGHFEAFLASLGFAHLGLGLGAVEIGATCEVL